MRKMTRTTLLVILAALVGFGSLAAAESALDMTGVTLRQSIELVPQPGCSSGWEFTPVQNLTVTKLGCYVWDTTLDYNHEITIYESATVPKVVSVTVGPGDVGSVEDGGYAYVDVSDRNVQLSKDQPYVIASHWNWTDDPTDWDILFATGYEVADETYLTLGELDLQASGQVMPTDLGDTTNRFLSANFQFVTNQPPVAVDDEAETTVDRPVTINVLENDSDPDGDVISVESVTPPATGTAVDNGDGTITYTPNPEFERSDTFQYTISDVDGATDIATVTVVGPVVMIEELVAAVKDLNGTYGIPNSLDAKLESAQKSLEDANQNNDVAAVNKLQAFINEVEAQSGNQIEDPEDADHLIEAAQAIIDLLTAS